MAPQTQSSLGSFRGFYHLLCLFSFSNQINLTLDLLRDFVDANPYSPSLMHNLFYHIGNFHRCGRIPVQIYISKGPLVYRFWQEAMSFVEVFWRTKLAVTFSLDTHFHY